MEDLGLRVARLADDMFEPVPDIQDYGWDEVLKWCRANNLEIIDDYVRVEDR